MVKVGDNIVTTNLSEKLSSIIVFGKFCNNIIFQNLDEKIYVVKTPIKKITEGNETSEQNQLRIQEAVLYIKNAIAKDGKTVYNVTIADFRNAPLIDEIDVSKFTGHSSSYIQIRAINDFMVKDVIVSIQNSDGTELESGFAVQQSGDIWWRYTATTSNKSLVDGRIIVRISDIPNSLTLQRKDK